MAWEMIRNRSDRRGNKYCEKPTFAELVLDINLTWFCLSKKKDIPRTSFAIVNDLKRRLDEDTDNFSWQNEPNAPFFSLFLPCPRKTSTVGICEPRAGF